ncbi:polysaccharide deacetylase [Glutamicibacter sp.]|uniref:polysaccharide deacetylase n=1 Tax=Glutamicibacter sp. TaxID=1931995 RepID=UPI002B4921CF|nr:polysaccharide deacetylase [Glutamicibacter sp.]HJX76919.1 polysaccharide deacetylase [Glutamicibacter sp.]
MKLIKIVVVAATILALAGCSDQSDPEVSANSASQEAEASEKAEVEAKREQSILAQINKLADGYDYATAIKLAKDDPSKRLNQLVRGLETEKKDAQAWEHPDQIPHLFFHSLVVDPKRAFDGESTAQGYEDYMVTQKEFEAIIDELYRRDFVLVNPADFAGLDKKKNMSYRKIMLPDGKKPIVLSLDDLSYYEYMQGDGFADRLILDKKGKVRNEYVDASGEKHVGAYDMTTILDDFVAGHPDFSYRDARGIIAMTGYNGVFGYRTSPSQYPDNKNLTKDREAATKIADAMKKEGWVFASHSWGHIATGTIDLGRFKRDMKLWKDEVEPILGKTDQFIYPFGSDISRTGSYSGAKYELLKDAGFKYFYGVDGTTTAWMQQRDNYQRQMRINIDGLQFAKEQRGDRPVLESFFDVKKVIDPAR